MGNLLLPILDYRVFVDFPLEQVFCSCVGPHHPACSGRDLPDPTLTTDLWLKFETLGWVKLEGVKPVYGLEPPGETGPSPATGAGGAQ